MICFVDLPSLTSIFSVEWSFSNPRVVTLASISEYWILIVFRYSKSSKCRSIWWLAWSFIRVYWIEINFEYCLLDLIWFDLIHRCFFDSRWSCQRHSVIQTLDIQTSFHSIPFKDQCVFIAYLNQLIDRLFHNPLPSFYDTHWFRIQSSIDSSIMTTQISLASIYRSFA